MRIVVVYKEQTDYARQVIDYIRDFRQQTGHELETMNPETRDGISFTTTYDIVEFPTIVAISDDGVLQNMWKGLPLPTLNELSYYA